MEGMLSALHTGPQAGAWEGTKDSSKEPRAGATSAVLRRLEAFEGHTLTRVPWQYSRPPAKELLEKCFTVAPNLLTYKAGPL